MGFFEKDVKALSYFSLCFSGVQHGNSGLINIQ